MTWEKKGKRKSVYNNPMVEKGKKEEASTRGDDDFRAGRRLILRQELPYGEERWDIAKC